MFEHYSVMLEESIKLLDIKPSGIYVDMTLGGAGHSKLILEKLNNNGRLIAFDQDQRAIDNAINIFMNDSRVTIIKQNFASLKAQLNKLGINKVDGVIFDLGVSSVQLDEQERGFSYRYDARLDMRMNQTQELDAYYIVNNYDFHQLKNLIATNGEEKYALSIARNIEKYRMNKPIVTTFELVEIIKASMPQSALRKKGHPAKKTFQAIRIAVNNELEVFKKALCDATELLNAKGRVVVITFHSLEDRICKKHFKNLTTSKIHHKIPVIDNNDVNYQLINTKVILPSKDELDQNTRSKSSKLRAIERKGVL